MGCTSASTNYDPIDYESNPKEDYLTKTIYESIMARKKAKIQDAFDAERKEQEEREKELMRQQFLLNSIDPKGPKSYIDNLINTEIPKMEFGNLASEEAIVNDLNDRECEEYGEGEKEEEDKEEEMAEDEIKEKQEKNKNEMEELKRKLEEMNKKSEEEKNKKNKNQNRKKKVNKDGFFGKKKEDKNNEEEKKDDDINEEEEEEDDENEGGGEKKSKNKKKKEQGEEPEESNEEEDELNGNAKKKGKKDMINKKDKTKDRKKELDEDKNEEDEGEEEEDDVEDGEDNKKKNKNKIKKDKTKKSKIKNDNDEIPEEIELENEIHNEESEDVESEEKIKILKKQLQEKKRIRRQNKMKELMKLKVENPPYIDKIKKYKYPKKEIVEKQKAEFSPSPSELIICVIGEEKNGKTSFIKKYTRNVFEEIYKKTENIDTYEEAEAEYDSKKIKLTILDTPPLNDRKKANLIQENGINKSHIIFYIVDINDEYADFKVKLTTQNFEFNEKQIIAVIGNKSDKVSIFSKKNKDTLGILCSVRKYIFEIMSCQDTPKNEIENFINEKIIKEYFRLYKD